jgi:hypothetical protein
MIFRSDRDRLEGAAVEVFVGRRPARKRCSLSRRHQFPLRAKKRVNGLADRAQTAVRKAISVALFATIG